MLLLIAHNIHLLLVIVVTGMFMMSNCRCLTGHLAYHAARSRLPHPAPFQGTGWCLWVAFPAQLVVTPWCKFRSWRWFWALSTAAGWSVCRALC